MGVKAPYTPQLIITKRLTIFQNDNKIHVLNKHLHTSDKHHGSKRHIHH